MGQLFGNIYLFFSDKKKVALYFIFYHTGGVSVFWFEGEV